MGAGVGSSCVAVGLGSGVGASAVGASGVGASGVVAGSAVALGRSVAVADAVGSTTDVAVGGTDVAGSAAA